MRHPLWVLALVLCGVSRAAGQDTAPDARAPVEWSVSAAVYNYLLPEEGNYAQPTVTVDHGRVHLEARYNYEDLETGSVWLGINVAGGEPVEWSLTPMLGGVFGATAGVAPGYKGTLNWWKLGFSSEGEYVFDASDSSGSFFYNWFEATLSPADWWRVGLVTQRTRVYATDRDIQRGVLVGFTFRHIDSALYVFNPDEGTPLTVVAVTVGF